MQLTRGVEYGIEGILCLARRCDGEPALIREISRATAIPETLPRGIIRSRRGFRGGSRLARPAGRISPREIVEAVQGPIEFHRCLDHLRARGRRHHCHVRRVFRQVQRKVASILQATS